MPPELEEIQNEVKQFTVDLKAFRHDSLTNWEAFKTENDKRLTAIENKQAVNPLLDEKIKKISDEVIAAQARFDQMSATLTRLNQTAFAGADTGLQTKARQFF